MAIVSLTFRETGLNQITTGVQRLGASMATAATQVNAFGVRLRDVGDRLSRLGTKLTLAISTPILLAGAALSKFAADAVESENLFEVALGNMAADAREFSERLQRDLGLNAFEVRRTIGTFFQMASAMGVSEDAAFEMSTALTVLTNDLASFFNLRVEDAFIKIQAAISGEVEPLKRLGIVVNETTIKNLAMTEGIIRQGEELSEQQKVLLRTIAIIDQTANAQGDLARTIESPSNQLRIMRARAENLAIELGTALLPVLTALLGAFNSILGPIQTAVTWFQNLSTEGKGLTIAIIGAVVAIGPLIKIIGVLLSAIGAVIAAFSGMGAIIAGVIAGTAALLGAIALVANSAEELGRIWDAVWSNIKVATLEAALTVVDAISGITNTITGALGAAGRFVSDEIGEMIEEFIGLEDTFDDMRQGLRDMIDAETVSAIESGTDSVRNTFSDLGDSVVADMEAVADTVLDKFTGMFESVGGAMETSTEEYQQLMAETRAALVAELENIAPSVNQVRAALDELNEEFAKLQGNLDPVIGAQQTMAEQLDVLQRALDQNVVSMEEFARLQGIVIANYDEEIEKIRQRTEAGSAANAKIIEELTNTDFKALSVAQSIHTSMTGAFKDILTDAVSFGDAMSNLFGAIIDSILEEFARIAASQVFKFIINAVGGDFGTLTGGGGLLGGIPIIGDLLGGIGSIFGGFFQTGGDFTVTRPTLIGVGEVGAERVRVSPLGGGRDGGAGMTVVLQAQTFLGDEPSLRSAARQLGRAMDRERNLRSV